MITERLIGSRLMFRCKFDPILWALSVDFLILVASQTCHRNHGMHTSFICTPLVKEEHGCEQYHKWGYVIEDCLFGQYLPAAASEAFDEKRATTGKRPKSQHKICLMRWRHVVTMPNKLGIQSGPSRPMAGDDVLTMVEQTSIFNQKKLSRGSVLSAHDCR